MKIKSALADSFSGLLIFVLPFVALALTDSLLPLALVSACLTFTVSFYRGKNSSLKPWMTFLLINSFLIALLIAKANQVNTVIILQSLSLLLLSIVALYAAKRWTEFSKAKRTIFAVVPLLTVCSFFVFNISDVTESLLTEQKNELAPEFKLTALDGEIINSKDLANKVRVLNFWATTCGSCLLELPELEQVYAQFKNNDDVKFLTINSELAGDTFELSSKFIKLKNYKLPFAHDFDGKAYKAFDIPGTPGLIIIDKLGRIRIKHIGFLKSEDFKNNLRRYIQTLLNE